jgi:hypothetical protein
MMRQTLLALAVWGMCHGAIQADAMRTGAFASSTLAANDDGSTGQIGIGFNINFFGQNYSQLYVNNNGNVTFTGLLSVFTPFGLTTSFTPIIAPFFADVDTRGAGSAMVSYGQGNLDGHAAFIVNWNGVGYYNQNTDKLNQFQLVLIDRGDTGTGNFDIEFNYDQIQWETGSASGGSGGLGGNSAHAGWSNGTGAPGTFFELAGSGDNGAFLDDESTGLVWNSLGSNVDGRYVFQARSGGVNVGPVTPPSVDEVPEPMSLLLFGGMVGGGVWWMKRRKMVRER